MRAEKQLIRAAFGAAATRYDAVAELQRRIARDLLSRTPAAHRMLDAGCGTGFGARLLRSAHAEANVFALDAAQPMCAHSGEALATCGDIEALPFANASFDLYWSSLAWQWTTPLLAAHEAARVLAPGGVLRVATLGPDSLRELREAFASVDSHAHVRDFDSLEHHANALNTAGFSTLYIERVVIQAFLPDLRTILRDLRQLGAHALGAARRRGMLGRQAWQRLETAYEAHRSPAGLPVSYDVIYLAASKA
ncbi:methyltransferase domain-containing protein [Uliginosibacterium sp. 31-12]|uniref:methyltransferase domain-containing protein n=1 Tax=Uliginosibacterium sp. 31-12 TaxID=3062781 RepID=UPI0026E422C3|nr:methyltransferase domain-containing protein [Uliginosibacterium sp. 31-12]MDO6385510.1 methyltransferase domain-containing protein [Uliginosibacterium sp. 31-12]